MYCTVNIPGTELELVNKKYLIMRQSDIIGNYWINQKKNLSMQKKLNSILSPRRA